jgi:hypothetical protein
VKNPSRDCSCSNPTVATIHFLWTCRLPSSIALAMCFPCFANTSITSNDPPSSVALAICFACYLSVWVANHFRLTTITAILLASFCDVAKLCPICVLFLRSRYLLFPRHGPVLWLSVVVASIASSRRMAVMSGAPRNHNIKPEMEIDAIVRRHQEGGVKTLTGRPE